MTRTAKQVLEDHLALVEAGDLARDIDENFADHCVLLTSYGRFEGKTGVVEAARLLERQLPNGRFEYHQVSAAGDVAFLEWSGQGDAGSVHDGADSFLVRDGRIHVMTIHYTVETAAP